MKSACSFKRGVGLFLLSAASVLLLAGTAGAQTYGSVTLAPGFGSQTLTGLSGGQPGVVGGEIDASAYGSTPTGACRGYIAAAPDHTMTLTAPIPNLQISVTATDGGDTALVLAGPTGAWCNDDSVGLNPAITGSFAVGTYSIWVASYSQGTNHPYTITFSSVGAVPPPPPPPPPVMGLNTASVTPTDPMGQMVLAAGFLPDPQTRSGAVTGSVDMNQTPNLYGGTCRGYVMPNPSHIMNLTTPFTYLRVHVRSPQDTTIVVQDPGGGFWCNDDTDGLNPVIEGPWQPGMWRIWIGTYSAGTTASYTVEFSEYQRQP